MAPATPIYVVGHRNPDADSICSAIAYAAYKELCGEPGHVAARCGNTNARIDVILDRFRYPAPQYLSDVYPRVRDMMAADPIHVSIDATCAEALELIDRHDLRVLPVLDRNHGLVGTVSVFRLGHFFMPQVTDPKLMRKVHTSLSDIARVLRADVLHLHDGFRIEDLYVRIGAMDAASFWRLSQAEGIPAENSIIVVGDRRDIQLRSIELRVRAIIITGNRPVADDVVSCAREAGVSLMVSPNDTATTAWLTRTAGRLAPLADRSIQALNADSRISDVRRKIGASPAGTFMVKADDGRLLGVFSKSDALRPSRTRLILVDHNELTQAVPGADEVTITEIIDHHRLAPLTTPQPILFLNEPVGSTCTIVADLYRRRGLRPDAALAGLMMSGLISDTLLLQSPTSTPKDSEILAWLESHAEIGAKELAELIFSSGSVILANPAARVVRSDLKTYNEEGARFAVSQVEELGFDNFRTHAGGLAEALSELRESEGLVFAALLVTDINTQNSLMLVKGDADLIGRISYAHDKQHDVFDLPGVVSRKKQLIPYLTGVLRNLAADGMVSGRRSAAPFGSGGPPQAGR